MIDLSGQRLTAVELDDAGILSLTIGDGWFVAVEGDYELAEPDGVRRTLDGVEDDIVAALTALAGSAVGSFEVRPDGSLRIGVGDTELVVPASPHFESWNVVGPEHVRVVSMPGGELATWGVTGGE